MTVFTQLNYLAVLAAAIVSYVVGFFWYSPLLVGNIWAKEIGVKMTGKASPPVFSMVGQFIAVILFSIGVSLLLKLTGQSGIAAGLWMAAILIAFVIVPNNAGTWFFKQKPVLFLIEAGYQSICALAAGIIIGLWK